MSKMNSLKNKNRHLDYESYIRHQKEKTLDPVRIEKWLNDEWLIKLEGFKDIFQRNWNYISELNKALCLGTRTGQEVKALLDLGKDAYGIDLVPFEPYTKEGDIHQLDFPDSTFDFVFSNIFDHSCDPQRFCREVFRVCTSGGVIMLHFQLGIAGDIYSENEIFDAKDALKYFTKIEILESREIKNTFDSMNWEVILRKI